MMRGLAEYFREKKSSFDFITRRNLKRQITRTIYKKETHSVLVATSSFWEGVDVRGDALSLVIIDKLSLPRQMNLCWKLALRIVVLQGGDPFNDIQILKR